MIEILYCKACIYTVVTAYIISSLYSKQHLCMLQHLITIMMILICWGLTKCTRTCIIWRYMMGSTYMYIFIYIYVKKPANIWITIKFSLEWPQSIESNKKNDTTINFPCIMTAIAQHVSCNAHKWFESTHEYVLWIIIRKKYIIDYKR